jgi:hypothetical protein
MRHDANEMGFVCKKSWYMYANISSAIAQGGHTIFFPVILAKLYGTKGGLLAYTVGFTFQASASVIGIIFNVVLTDTCGFEGICFIYSYLCIASLLMLFFVYRGAKTDQNDEIEKIKSVQAAKSEALPQFGALNETEADD